jgi:hypothetical protein
MSRDWASGRRLMTQPPDTFRAAALLYGYMLDVPEAAQQFGLGDASRATIRRILAFLAERLTA